LDDFAQQIQDMQQRLTQLQRYAGKSPTLRLTDVPEVANPDASPVLTEQQQQETIEIAFEELSIALEELQVANEELFQQHEELCRQNQELSVAQQAVEAERQRYQELFEFAPDAYLVTDTNGVIQEANRAAATLLNISQTFLVGKALNLYVVKNERPVFHSKLTELYQADEVQEWEMYLQPRNKTPIIAAVKVAAVRNQLGNLVCLRWLLRDIIDRKRIDLELRQAHDRLQLAANALNGIIYDWDIDTRTIKRTEGLFNVLGYCPEEAEPTPDWWTQRIHPDDQQRVRQEVSDALTNRSNYTIEYRIHHKNEHYLHILEKALIIRDATGRAVRVVGSNIDITPRKQAEMAQRESEQRLSALAKLVEDIAANIPGTVYRAVLHPDGKMSLPFISDGVRDLSGIEPQEAIANPERFLAIIHPDDRAQFEQVLRTGYETLQSAQHEFRIITTSGQVKWFQDSARYWRMDNNDVVVDGVTLDITERKQALEALRESETRLQAILDNSPTAIYLKDLQSRYLMVNRQCQTMARLLTDQLLGKTDRDFLPQAITDRLHSNDQQVLASKTPILQEGEVPMEDGLHTFITVKFPLLDATGVPYAVCGISTDITERKRAEEALQRLNQELENRVRERTAELERLNEQLILEIGQRARVEAALRQREQEFRALAENAPDVIERFDRELRHVYVNPAIEKATGKSPSEFIGKTNRELGMSEANLSLWQEVLRRIFETGQEEQIEFSIVTPNGLKYYQSRFVPEFVVDGDHSTDGTPVYVLGISRDISARKLALEALRESEERFRQLAENIHEVFWMTSVEDLRIIYASPAYEEVWGRTCESLYENRLSWLDAVHREDRDRVRVADEKQLEETYDQEYRIVRPDGSIRWIRDRGFPVHDEQGKVYRFAGISEDITSRKQAEFETYKALQRERELGELKSRFISMTSHEFRTPLTTIQSSAELLERYRDRLSEEKQLAHLHRIQTAVERMTQMLDDVLIVGKAESGKLEFQPTPIDVVQFCRNLVEELQLTAKNQHKINFIHQGDCTLAAQGTSEEGSGELIHSLPLVDEKLLRHILGNLLSNAIKYSPGNRSVQFNLTCLNDKAIFQIQDQGIGIPPEDLPRLFESFHRARNVGTIQGTGLGLAIVKQCVDLHKGEITVASEVGKGTTFTVTLPLTN
jgi:PAS domain S-box-containing protein